MASNSVTRGVPRQIAQDRARIGVVDPGAVPRIHFSTGTAKALQDLSATMFAASDFYEDRLDDIAEAEATTQGAIAGATGDFDLADYATIRGRAFNRAGIDAFVATLETRSVQKVFDLKRQYAGDPDGLTRELDSYTAGVGREIDKVSPGAGVIYRQRQQMRNLPAVEAARDEAFKLRRDQADAMLIESEVALTAEIKSNAADLFSDNPARSEAAARSVALVQSELMRVYNATDPATGKPLYSAEERAAARAKYYSDTMTAAALSGETP